MDKNTATEQSKPNMILSSKASFIHQRIRKNTVFAAFCAIFAAIYEHFSHQVYSPYMICAFLFPVCLGIVPDIIRLKLCKSPKYLQKAGQIYSRHDISHIYEISLVMQQCGIYICCRKYIQRHTRYLWNHKCIKCSILVGRGIFIYWRYWDKLRQKMNGNKMVHLLFVIV